MKIVCEEKQVSDFISRFLPKFEVWGIIFLNREKNFEALRSLGITSAIREEIIRNIEVQDYVETILDDLTYGDMWVFGKDYSGSELYIKIAIGSPQSRTICVSFHKAEHRIKYAFAKQD